MFKPVWTPRARVEYDRLKEEAERSLRARRAGKRSKATKAEGLFKQVLKCVQTLLANPKHPGLNTHKFHSLPHPYDAGRDVFVAYVQNHAPGAYRLFWCYGPGKGEITLIAITPHP